MSAAASISLTGIMLSVCGWCQAAMGSKACLPELDGSVSHGICPRCREARQKADRLGVARYRAEELAQALNPS